MYAGDFLADVSDFGVELPHFVILPICALLGELVLSERNSNGDAQLTIIGGEV